MALTATTLHHYSETQPRRAKWSWAQSFWFIVFTCGAFWAGAAALAWRYI